MPVWFLSTNNVWIIHFAPVIDNAVVNRIACFLRQLYHTLSLSRYLKRISPLPHCFSSISLALLQMFTRSPVFSQMVFVRQPACCMPCLKIFWTCMTKLLSFLLVHYKICFRSVLSVICITAVGMSNRSLFYQMYIYIKKRCN